MGKRREFMYVLIYAKFKFVLIACKVILLCSHRSKPPVELSENRLLLVFLFLTMFARYCTGAQQRYEQEVDAAVPAVRVLLQQAVQARAAAVRGRHLLHRHGYRTVYTA